MAVALKICHTRVVKTVEHVLNWVDININQCNLVRPTASSPVPGLGALSTGSLPGGDTQRLGGHADWATHAQTLALSLIN